MNKNNNLFVIILLIIIVALAIGLIKHRTNAPDIPQSFIYSTQPLDGKFDPNRIDRIDSVLSRMVESGALPNVVTFVAKDGIVVHNKAYGYKNIEKNIEIKKDDIFRIASQTKAITSATLMTLYEEGKFLLDDPIKIYIPEFANPQILETFNANDTTYTTIPAKHDITIRQLLTHTSGIHYGILGGGKGGMMFEKEGIPAVNSLDSLTIEKVVKKIAKMPLLFEPGKKFMYGMNTDVIGYLIEVLTGKKLDVVIKERILDPLGMDDSYFYLPKNESDRLVTLYSSRSKGLKVNNNVSYQTYPVAGAKMFLSGGAGLCGPIADYAKFCQMMLNKGEFNNTKVLSRKTVELMTRNQIGDLSIGRYGNKFGLGFELFGEGGAASHLGSEGTFKWGGMYYTDYLIDPTENIIMLVYTNVQPYRGENMHEKFHNLVYQALN